MKKKWVVELVLVVVLACALVGTVVARPAPTATPEPPQTYHWLLEAGDDAWVLCSEGRFVVEVNGGDSIHLLCVGD